MLTPMALSPRREAVVRRLLEEFQHVAPGRPALIAIDGFDGAGKSRLASELVTLTSSDQRPVISVTIDQFHRPRAERDAAGKDANGFYHGSYQYDRFIDCVVEPLRRGQPMVTGVWDVAADEPLTLEPVSVARDVIVLVDGIFLHRPELLGVWDASVWVDVPFEISVPRGNARFPGAHDPDPQAASNQRYVGGQRLYLSLAQPFEHCTWILDNSEIDAPVLSRPE